MAATVSSTPQILRLPRVKDLTALSRSTIYAEMAAGRFPQNVRLTAKSVGWLLSDVQAYIEARVAQSRNRMKEAV